MRHLVTGARVAAVGALLAWGVIAASWVGRGARADTSDLTPQLLALGASALLPLLGFAVWTSVAGALARGRIAGLFNATPGTPSVRDLARVLALEAMLLVAASQVLAYAWRPLVPQGWAFRDELAHIAGVHTAAVVAAVLAAVAWRAGLGAGRFPWWSAAVLHLAARLWMDGEIARVAPGRGLWLDAASVALCSVAACGFGTARARSLALQAGVPVLSLSALGALYGASALPGATATMVAQAHGPGAALGLLTRLYDVDGDGFAATFGGFDCDDQAPAIHPMALEIVGDGIDNNCMGGDLEKEALPAPPTRREDAPRHDVILVVIDTLRADMLAASDPVVMPNLRALGERAAVFTRAYAHAPYTSESMRVLLTGQLPMNMTIFGAWLGMEAPLQRVLGAAGYQTSALTQLSLRADDDSGIVGQTTPALMYFDRVDNWAFDEPFETITSPDTTERGIREIERLRAAKRPYFMWLHYFDPHSSYLRREGTPFGSETLVDRYRGEVFATDRDLGRLIAHLESIAFFERGYLVVTSDHGELLGEHGRYQHALSLDEEVLRVPLVIRGPGVPAGRYDTRVRHLDVFPTILEHAAGIRAPTSGRDLAEVWSGRELDDRDVIATTTYGKRVIQRAILQGRYKLVMDVLASTVAVHDLHSDRPERNFVDELPAVRTRLIQSMGEVWDRAMNDRILARRRGGG